MPANETKAPRARHRTRTPQNHNNDNLPQADQQALAADRDRPPDDAPETEPGTEEKESSLTEPVPSAEPATATEQLSASDQDLAHPPPSQANQASQAPQEIVQLALEELHLHPALEHIPRMRPDEWQQFLEDVQQHGVREPVTVQRGQPHLLLDGRHRREAAQEAGLTHVPVRLVDLTEDEQEQAIYASALLRRHLTDDQRAVLAARYYGEEVQQANQDRARKGGQAGGRGRRKQVNSSEDAASCKLSDGQKPKGRKTSTRQRLAKEHAVPERKLQKAITLEQEAPELAQQVLDGEITLLEATQARRREEQQETPPVMNELQPPVEEAALAEAAASEQPVLASCRSPASSPVLQVPASSPVELAEALVQMMGREKAVNFLHEALAVVEALPGELKATAPCFTMEV